MTKNKKQQIVDMGKPKEGMNIYTRIVLYPFLLIISTGIRNFILAHINQVTPQMKMSSTYSYNQFPNRIMGIVFILVEVIITVVLFRKEIAYIFNKAIKK